MTKRLSTPECRYGGLYVRKSRRGDGYFGTELVSWTEDSRALVYSLDLKFRDSRASFA